VVSWLRAHSAACELVIIDIFLTAGSGLGVLRAAMSLQSVPSLAVLTNYATPAIRAQCMELGADRVFDKSNELDELVDYCNGLAMKREPSFKGC
jgi:two-component system OmpR family response regulator